MRSDFLLKMLAAAALSPLAWTSPASGATATTPTYDWANLASDIRGVGIGADENLINPYGLLPSLNQSLVVTNNETGVVTLYDLKGNLLPAGDPTILTVPPASTGEVGSPTGMILNFGAFGNQPSPNFKISHAVSQTKTITGPSVYLLASDDGGIFGYNANVDPNNAVLGHATVGAVYKGLAVSLVGPETRRLYATNFRRGTVDVFDDSFTPVTTSAAFVDPNGTAGYAPFNIKRYTVVDNSTKPATLYRFLIVTFARQDANGLTDVPGAGNGYVDAFMPDGTFVKRLAPDPNAPNELNSPYGLAFDRHPTPAAVGPVLLVGNAGDGKIHRYQLDLNPADAPLSFGTMKDANGNDLQFDGLWTLHYAQKTLPRTQIAANEDELDEDESALYFSAGCVGRDHGMVGSITAHK